ERAAAVLEEHAHLARPRQILDHALPELGVLDPLAGLVGLGHLVEPDRPRQIGLHARLVDRALALLAGLLGRAGAARLAGGALARRAGDLLARLGLGVDALLALGWTVAVVGPALLALDPGDLAALHRDDHVP